MLSITYRQHGIRLGHACFLSNEDYQFQTYRKIRCDLLWLYGLNQDPGGVYLRTQHTVIKDLLPDEDALYASLGKKLRYHIRKNQREEDIKVSIYESCDLLQDRSILLICKQLLEKMYSAKGKTSQVQYENGRSSMQKKLFVDKYGIL